MTISIRHKISILGLTVLCGWGLLQSPATLADHHTQSIADQIIALEKAAAEAWQRKDRTFYEDYLADDSTYFGPQSPYLDTDPKVNFLPKFERYVEMFKLIEFQMYNPRVQVYGDTAVLTYNSAVVAEMGGRVLNYTAKMTVVYVKQGNRWRVVHGHESMNPGAQ